MHFLFFVSVFCTEMSRILSFGSFFSIVALKSLSKFLSFVRMGPQQKREVLLDEFFSFFFYSKKRTNLMVVRPILPVVELLVSIEGASRLIERILGLQVSKDVS